MSQVVLEPKGKGCRSLQRGNHLEIYHLNFMVESGHGLTLKSVSEPRSTQAMDQIRYFQVQAAVQIVRQEINKPQGSVNYNQDLGVHYVDIANCGLSSTLSSLSGTVEWL